jgi:hypothetical protein
VNRGGAGAPAIPFWYPAPMKSRTRVVLLLAIVIGLTVATALVPRIAQDPAYHQFADQRTLFGIPHFFDVVSNVPFLFIGAWGLLVSLQSSKQMFAETSERWPYVVLFLGVLLTSFGSSYYHWNPNNHTLVWDRLPMTVGFMGLLSATIAERINHGFGIRWLLPLVLLGIASVVYWNRTELAGAGDLRPYVLVQFGSLLVLILILILFPPKYTGGRYIGYAIGFYALAKVLELADVAIYRVLRVVSGHTLKHLAAASAIVWIVWMLKMRTIAGGLNASRYAR